jgi:hypothetical protein
MSPVDAGGTRTGFGGMMRGLLVLGGLVALRSAYRRLTGRQSGRPPREPRQPRQPRVDSHAVAAGHETKDAPIRWVIVAVVVLVVGIGVVVLVATTVQTAWVGRPMSISQPPGLATPVVPPPPPEPRLEEEPGSQLRQLRASEDRMLNGTDWVDRQAGVARIPIDRAIDLLAANPPPARTADEASQAGISASPTPSKTNSGRGSLGVSP